MNAHKAQVIGVIAVFALAAASLLGLIAWQWQTPNGRPHEIFGRHEFVRVELPPPIPLPTPEPSPQPEGTDDSETALADGAGESADGRAGGTATSQGDDRITFAEHFGDLEMEVRNPTWLDLTFDLAEAGRTQSDVNVAKAITYNGANIGSLQLEFGGGSTVLVNPKELIALLDKTAVDTAPLQGLAGRDKVAFADLRAVGFDLRYRPAQDQLALELAQ